MCFSMNRILISLITVCTVFTLNAKTWEIIGSALNTDTTLLVQDAAKPNVYKYTGKLTNNSFKVYDGVHSFVPPCGLNDPFEQLLKMEQQTDTLQMGFTISFVNPNSIYQITLTDGATPTIAVEKVVPYDQVYLVGGPVNTQKSNWALKDARELEKDPSNPFVFYYRGLLKYNTYGEERGAIKFLATNSAWDPSFHPVGVSNVPLGQASKMQLGGVDTKWEIPADGSGNGYYVIKLNTLDKTISVLQFKQVKED